MTLTTAHNHNTAQTRVAEVAGISFAYRRFGRPAEVPLGNAPALGLERIDLLGFSIGGFIAQDIALVRPTLLRRLGPRCQRPERSPRHGQLA